MANDFSICVGTVGQGVWQSPDGGDNWNRMRMPFPLETRVRSLARHPAEPHTILAGADSGLYRSADNGASWEQMNDPEQEINAITITAIRKAREVESIINRARNPGCRYC